MVGSPSPLCALMNWQKVRSTLWWDLLPNVASLLPLPSSDKNSGRAWGLSRVAKRPSDVPLRPIEGQAGSSDRV